MYIYIYIRKITYLYIYTYYLKKILIKINVATDEGNSRNKIGH